MTTKRKEDLKEKKCPLKIGDWIAFLTNRPHSRYNIVLLLATLIIAGVAGWYSLGRHEWYIGLPFSIAFLIILIAFLYINQRVTKELKLSDEIVKDIIDGKFKDPNKIRKRWKEGMKKIYPKGKFFCW